MLKSRNQSITIFLILVAIGIVFWPKADSRVISEEDWKSQIKSTSDIADLKWKVEFKIEAAPPPPFAFVASHGRDVLHGFHITIDFYGNGFLVLSDVKRGVPENRIVFLGSPITGTHKFSMHFRQRDKKILWKSVQIFFDGAEIPFHSGDPKKTIDIRHIRFVPDVIDPITMASFPKSGEIISESLILRTWNEDTNLWIQQLLLFLVVVLLVIQKRQVLRVE